MPGLRSKPSTYFAVYRKDLDLLFYLLTSALPSTLFTGRSVCFSLCSRELLARALGSPFFLFGRSPRFGQNALGGLARLTSERIVNTMKTQSCCSPRRTCSSAKPPRYARGLPPTQQSGQFVSVSPRTVRASSRPGPDRRYEELTGRQGRSKPPDERMEEQSRRRGAQQGAEGELAGRAVGADFLMTSWAVSPHPHRVCAFKVP